jgi:hypothetical protein
VQLCSNGFEALSVQGAIPHDGTPTPTAPPPLRYQPCRAGTCD